MNFKLIQLVLAIFLAAEVTSQVCKTTSDSKNPNKPCIFPFIFRGVEYTKCPQDLQVSKFEKVLERSSKYSPRIKLSWKKEF